MHLKERGLDWLFWSLADFYFSFHFHGCHSILSRQGNLKIALAGELWFPCVGSNVVYYFAKVARAKSFLNLTASPWMSNWMPCITCSLFVNYMYM